MRRFSEKILKNRWENTSSSHTRAWSLGLGKTLKDKRSRFITSADKKNAFIDFSRSVKAEMMKHPEMSQKEAMDKVLDSRAFSTYDQISARNIAKVARDYNIHVNKNGLVPIGDNTWKIIYGPHAGHILTLEHDPESHPSYFLIIK